MSKIAEGTPITAKVNKSVVVGFYANLNGETDAIIVPGHGIFTVDKDSIKVGNPNKDQASYQQVDVHEPPQEATHE